MALFSYNAADAAIRISVDSFSYEIDEQTNTAAVVGLANGVTTVNNPIFPNQINYNDNKFTIVEIKQSAFSDGNGFIGDNEMLTGILTLPSTIKVIGKDAFNECTKLTGTLVIPEGVTTIAYGAFSFCQGFTGSLKLPNSITSMGEYAFAYCYGFDGQLTLPNHITEIAKSTFISCNFTGELVISESVTKIGDSAFMRNKFTGKLLIPRRVTEIANGAFYGNANITSLIIGESVIKIGAWAFDTCTELKEIELPASIKYIGGMAFNACDNISSIICNAITPPTISDPYQDKAQYEQTAFSSSAHNNAKLFVPSESIEKYKTKFDWGDFKSINPIASEATGIILNNDNISIEVGEQYGLVATIIPDNATDKTIVWTTSNPAIVTVNSLGIMTGASVGTANVTATCGGVTATCKVTVKPVTVTTITKFSATDAPNSDNWIRPTSKGIQISVESGEGVAIAIYKINGTLVYSQIVEGGAMVSDMITRDTLAQGTYVVTVKSGDILKSKKIIIR